MMGGLPAKVSYLMMTGPGALQAITFYGKCIVSSGWFQYLTYTLISTIVCDFCMIPHDCTFSTHDHRVWRIGLPVRSAVFKPHAGQQGSASVSRFIEPAPSDCSALVSRLGFSGDQIHAQAGSLSKSV